ncbi:hypothetical protein C8R44DRAFT_949252 [Mycena epipterygia]|nr:hypothetical protein C8R44DRAFT_949252 [Mycena epipterygia]
MSWLRTTTFLRRLLCSGLHLRQRHFNATREFHRHSPVTCEFSSGSHPLQERMYLVNHPRRHPRLTKLWNISFGKLVSSSTSSPRPQELLDLILDYVNLDPATRVAALRACALAAPLLAPRSQMHLFSVVHLDPSERLPRFFKLFSSSPHIGSYVKELRIQPTYKNLLVKAGHILSLLPNLEILAITPIPPHLRPVLITSPTHVRPGLPPPTTLLPPASPTFSDATKLDSFLSQSGTVVLKDVTLGWVRFKHRRPTTDIVSGPPRVVIKSLTICDMGEKEIRSILNLCHATDVKHLKRLVLSHVSPAVVKILLRANAHSIEEVHLQEFCMSDTRPFDNHRVAWTEPENLAESRTLHSIHLYVARLDQILDMLRLFGTFSNLPALSSITLLCFFSVQGVLFNFSEF